MAWIVSSGFSPRIPTGGSGSSGLPTLLATFDLAALDAADWTGEASVDLTPSAGSVTDPVTWIFGNAASLATWGPDGAAGVAWVLPSGTGNWGNSAYPTGTPYMRADLSDFLAGFDNNTEVLLVGEWVGDRPVDAFQMLCAGLGDGTRALTAFDIFTTSPGPSERVTLSSHSPSRLLLYSPTAASPNWFGLRALNAGCSGLSGYGSGDFADWFAGTAMGAVSFVTTTPSATNLLDLANCAAIFSAASPSGDAFTPILAKIHVFNMGTP